MREQRSCIFLGIVLIATIVYFSFVIDEPIQPVVEAQQSNAPIVLINGQSFTPGFNDHAGRMIIVVDQDDMFVGENTVEILLDSAKSSILTAELPSE
jgi:hypothetical protein